MNDPLRARVPSRLGRNRRPPARGHIFAWCLPVHQRILALVIGAALATGCSGSGRPVAVPTTVADCGKGIYFGGPDGGVMAGLDWPHGSWALRTPAQAYICLGNYSGSTVRILQSGAQLTVEPAEQTAPPGGGVMPVSITATAERPS